MSATGRRWLPFSIFAGAVSTIVVCADMRKLGWLYLQLGRVPYADKFGHTILFGALALLLNKALNGRRVSLPAYRPLLGSFIILVATTVEECSQIWIRGRTFDFVDLGAAIVGILLAGLPWSFKQRSIQEERPCHHHDETTD